MTKIDAKAALERLEHRIRGLRSQITRCEKNGWEKGLGIYRNELSDLEWMEKLHAALKHRMGCSGWILPSNPSECPSTPCPECTSHTDLIVED